MKHLRNTVRRENMGRNNGVIRFRHIQSVPCKYILKNYVVYDDWGNLEVNFGRKAFFFRHETCAGPTGVKIIEFDGFGSERGARRSCDIHAIRRSTQ